MRAMQVLKSLTDAVRLFNFGVSVC